MAIGSVIRRIGFWTIDIIKGGHVKRHYRDIQQLMENTSSENTIKRRNELLEELLDHTVKTVPFYSQYENVEFKEFPIIGKNLVQDNFEGFKSDKFQNKKLYKIATSGSTGVPFFLFFDQNKRNRNIADTLFFLKNVGYNIGDRLYYFRLWKGEKKSELVRLLQNIVKVDISKMTDGFIIDLLNKLRLDRSSKYCIGIASSLETLCNYLDRNNVKDLDFNIKSIIANSEALNTNTKTLIKKYFNVPIVSRYSNEEQGIIAQQKPNDNDYFQINWASYVVEVFHLEKDIPAKPGEMGRIIVTDLFNYSMPLIRYDTGDIGTMNLVDNEYVLTTVEGRKMDLIYDTNGDLISSYSIYPILHNYYHLIKQYQFIQNGKKEYLVKLNVDREFCFDGDLIKNFKQLLGEDAVITIDYVYEIPALSSGKRKKVLNTYTLK